MRNKARTRSLLAATLNLLAIGFMVFPYVRAGRDRDVKSVSVFCERGRALYVSVDLATNELVGVFLVDSFKAGGVPNPPTSATSVKSEISDEEGHSLGSFEWTSNQVGTLPNFTFKIPKEIHAKRLHFSIKAE